MFEYLQDEMLPSMSINMSALLLEAKTVSSSSWDFPGI